jgi:hypothetical protein
MQELRELDIGALEVIINMQDRELLNQPQPIRIGVRINELGIRDENQMMRRRFFGLYTISASLSRSHPSIQRLTHLSHFPHSQACTALSKTRRSPQSNSSAQTTTNKCGRLNNRFGFHLCAFLNDLGILNPCVDTEL